MWIVLPFISAEASGPKHLNTVLAREQYETLTELKSRLADMEKAATIIGQAMLRP